MATVYILYSKSKDRFYTGSCKDLNSRLEEHLCKLKNKAFTSIANDWKVFFKIDNLHYKQARLIEQHIKRMKSKTYIHNLNKYPEMSHKLISKYNPCEGSSR